MAEMLLRGWTRHAKRVLVLLGGTTLLLIGAALLVLPGPGIPVVIAGFALLGLEFAWAKRLNRRMRAHARLALRKLRNRRKRRDQNRPLG